MFRSTVVLTTTIFMVLLNVGEPGSVAQQRQDNQVKTAQPGDAAALGVQEVGIEAWQPQPQQLPQPKEISAGATSQVELTPGPKKPGDVPEQEDHRGIQVNVLNP